MIQERKCSNCKEVKALNVDNFHTDKSRPLGFMYTCKVCEKKRSSERHLKNPRTDKYSSMTTEQKKNKLEWNNRYCKTPKGRAISNLNSYIKYDRKKGFETDLTQEDFLEVYESDCVYCGFKATGFDRKDNLVGHTKSNCVPCCKECNISRMDHFTHEEMFIIGKSIREVKLLREKNDPPHIELG